MKKRILIIEDDAFFADVLKNKLEGYGCEVEWVADGTGGFDKIKEMKPDLVLLDILLPGMNGYEILDKQRQVDEIRDIPVIVISNSGQPVEIERVLELGAKDYLIKAQFGPNEVMDKVIACLGDLDGEEKDPGSIKGKTIFIVEDDEFLSDLLKEKFEMEEAEIVHVTSGEELFTALDDKKPDLILLDIVLPRMDGYEILDAIRNDEKVKDVPVVMLSNLGQRSDVEKGKEKGANKFLVKALFSLDQVVKEVKKTINEKK